MDTTIFLWIFLAANPGAAGDFTGTRPLGMGGAHRAIVTGNDAIMLNPAGMSLFQRYSFEGQYQITPEYGQADGPAQHVFHASVVDNQMQLFATGLAYTRIERGESKKGNRFDLAFSFPVSENLFLGTNFKYLNFKKNHTDNVVDAVTVDVGALIRTSFDLSLGVVGYNLTNTADYLEHPICMAAAAMYSPFRSLELSFDWLINFQKPKDIANPVGDKETGYSYLFGIEYFLLGQFTLRGGFELDQSHPDGTQKYWSLGAGYINPKVALDFGYRGSTSNRWDNTFSVGLRLFM